MLHIEQVYHGLGAPCRYCDIVAAMPHITRYLVRVVSCWHLLQICAKVVPLGTWLHRDTSLQYSILQHIARWFGDFPWKQAPNSFAILSLQVSCDMKSITRVGSLRSRALVRLFCFLVRLFLPDNSQGKDKPSRCSGFIGPEENSFSHIWQLKIEGWGRVCKLDCRDFN